VIKPPIYPGQSLGTPEGSFTRVCETAMLAPAQVESRSERLTHACEWCRTPLPDGRVDQRFCCGKCRRDAWTERAHYGRVATVRRLKNGLMSVTIHMPDVGLRPSGQVRLSEESRAESRAFDGSSPNERELQVDGRRQSHNRSVSHEKQRRC
jgi:hypothetical protein